MSAFVVNKKFAYRAFIWILLFVGIYILGQLIPTLFNPAYLSADDFTHFWSAGRLNLQGKNPFDPTAVAELKALQGGYSSIKIAVSLNPPWTITLLMPLGLIKYPISRVLWLLFSIIFILISTIILTNTYSINKKYRWLTIIAAFLFGPTISVLEKGQLTTLVILGITAFMYFAISKRNDWLAGVFLSLASIKPQVAVLFWIALFFWVIKQKRWIILISLALSVLIMFIVAILFNHNLVKDYITSLQTYKLSDWATPTIGAYLRLFWLGVDKFWLQYLPTALGIIWIIFYWLKRRQSWNWTTELPVIVLVSLIVSPYSWTYDAVIALPAIIIAISWILHGWKNWTTLLVVLAFLAVNVLDLYLHTRLDEFWFIWLAPVLTILFFFIRYRYSDKLEPGKLTISSSG